MQKELKPATAKGKAKGKAGPKASVKAKAAPKAAASAGSRAPPDGAADVDRTYSLRRHKRKTSHGELRTFAINCIETGKQLAQLSEAACQDAESVVGI